MDDPIDLSRFVEAQASIYSRALAELRAGRKTSHWMWFVFPQLAGLGFSAMSQRFAIRSIEEAQAYLAHPVLGSRLRECVGTVLALENLSAHDIFGSPDDAKLRSCLTLFARATANEPIFAQALDRHFEGRPDPRTLALLQSG